MYDQLQVHNYNTQYFSEKLDNLNAKIEQLEQENKSLKEANTLLEGSNKEAVDKIDEALSQLIGLNTE